jgi:glycerol-3-phosphate dehydrogenase
MNQHSALNRTKTISLLKDQIYDLIIIGGGITGAGIALDAASRGMKVALIEKKDFANGTSSKSTKLIHGGLRYLKKFEVNLVREVGRERAIVHDIAPHMVVPKKMLLPLYDKGTYGFWGTSIGLWVYDFLATVRKKDRRKMLNKAEAIEKEPLLKQTGLNGAGYYAEYRADDARLTIENIKTAIDHGAVCINYIKAEKFLYGEDGKIIGLLCKDELGNESFELKGSYIINATGPWTDRLRKKDDGSAQKKLFLSKGIHIVIPKNRFPLRQAVYFDVSDKRMIFALPHHRAVYIGTTDTQYLEDMDDIHVLKEEVEYLLTAANNMFPDIKLKMEDVESSWAGLRPLIFKRGQSAGELSRKDEIFISKNDLITITGGKLTGYRKMAERVVDLVAEKFKKNQKQDFGSTKTIDLPLTGGPFQDGKDLENYRISLSKQLKTQGLEAHWPDYMLENYGRQSDLILEKMKTFPASKPEINLASAEAWFSIHHEQAHSLLDFFGHRTGRLHYDMPGIEDLIDVILGDFEAYFKWNEQQKKQAIAELREAMEGAVGFKTY